ncbi:hypothetical protein G5C60_05805 [Streptomyces sp. HC44]|uniref:Secreted protein n=1 Tax=Streptomyces scabichelini TaxID=2711217 RepID=A0A6G4UZW3_9ACTN|nr:hypothetical protein [Streptomyces scabichelini]NGO07173.1 hypothetical protein [Streptomyces scabichelini]
MLRHARTARSARRLALSLATLAVVGTSTATASAEASAPTAEARPATTREFDFGACPSLSELPAGADPGAWRCEAMNAVGHLTLGRIDQPLGKALTITFAEGTVNGEFHQVFGEMRAAPVRIRGTALTITPRYAGHSDFQSNDERRGELDLKFRLSGPAVPPGCSIGTDAAPVRLVLKETEAPTVVSPDPLVVSFGVEDKRFAGPTTSGCGRLGPVLDAALRLPSPGGANGIDLDARVAFRSYSEGE